MPFFCAVPANLLIDPEGVRAYAGAGPYYVAAHLPGNRVVLRRNRFYRGRRPHHVNSFVVDLAHTPDEILPAIEGGAADWGSVRPTYFADRYFELKRRYGLNRSRFWNVPGTRVNYFVLNMQSPLLRNNLRLRRAVNFAVDRRALAGTYGAGSASPTDQYLPIGFPGFRDAHIYRLSPDVRTAQTLARGHLRSGRAVLYTRSDLPVAVIQAQIVKANLARLGLSIEIKAIPAPAYYQRLLTPGEPFDIAWFAWNPDYADPYAFINVLLHGRKIGTSNYARFNSTKYNRLMDRASRLRGSARYRAYTKLDVMLTRNAAPMIAFATSRSLTLVSRRVGCVVVRPNLDLAAVCLKR
jgi:peptide/nickel transport system substrate-binding protein